MAPVAVLVQAARGQVGGLHLHRQFHAVVAQALRDQQGEDAGRHLQQ
jgi:hypothetical protein